MYITLLIRLSPILPFGVSNYVCGCTQIPLWQWIVGTFFGVLPGTTAYCNLGAMGKQAVGGTTPLQKAVLGIQVVAGLGAVWYLNKVAVEALEKEGISDQPAPKSPKA